MTTNDSDNPNTTNADEAITSSQQMWTVYRIDDNGNVFVVRDHVAHEEADRLVAMYEARGHKQMYWAELDQAEKLAN
jgi:hypothetical protein